jgi:hypothetical protein
MGCCVFLLVHGFAPVWYVGSALFCSMQCVGSYSVVVLLAFSVVTSNSVLHIAFFYLGQNSQRLI